jgi:sulfate adenylyltransferase
VTDESTGICIWLTGLSGAGKTTIARALAEALRRRGLAVTVLDGDELRAGISAGLGFSREDRATQVMRVAALAEGVVGRGELAICALVSPFRDMRRAARDRIGPTRFLEVFVATPLVECERRDPKGLYRRARLKEIVGLTGVDAPYEPPDSPDLEITTVDSSVDADVSRILDALSSRNVLRNLP